MRLTNALLIAAMVMLSGCEKNYTPADFLKDSALRDKYLQQCAKTTVTESKNCQNARLAQQKVNFAQHRGKTEFTEQSKSKSD